MMGQQWKLDLDTGKAHMVPSKAKERHVTEKQGSLDLWALEQERLAKLQQQEKEATE